MKPCKSPGCTGKRYRTFALCRTHYYEKLREKKAAREAKRKTTKKYIAAQRGKIKRKLDATFSRLIRSVNRCAKCGRLGEVVQLQTSHIYTRANLAVRWDELNAKCLCAADHRWWHQNPLEAGEWLKTIRTEEQLTELRRRANEARHWTVPELQALLEELTKKLNEICPSPKP